MTGFKSLKWEKQFSFSSHHFVINLQGALDEEAMEGRREVHTEVFLNVITYNRSYTSGRGLFPFPLPL